MADSIWWAGALVADAVLCAVLATRVQIGEVPPREVDCGAEETQLRMTWLARMLRGELTARPSGDDAYDREVARWRANEIARLETELHACGTPMDAFSACYGFDADNFYGTSAEQALCSGRTDGRIRPM